jgi:hypothetical protein
MRVRPLKAACANVCLFRLLWHQGTPAGCVGYLNSISIEPAFSLGECPEGLPLLRAFVETAEYQVIAAGLHFDRLTRLDLEAMVHLAHLHHATKQVIWCTSTDVARARHPPMRPPASFPVF